MISAKYRPVSGSQYADQQLPCFSFFTSFTILPESKIRPADLLQFIRAVEADIHIRGFKLVRTGIGSFIFQIGSIIQGSGGKNKRQHEKSNSRRCAGGKPPQKGTESALKTKRILL
jgi:hypothetical protein